MSNTDGRIIHCECEDSLFGHW